MADHEVDGPRDARVPSELFRPTTTSPRASSPAAVDLAEALGGLDRATRNFTRRLGEGQLEVERARQAGEQAIREASESSEAAEAVEVDAVEPHAEETPDDGSLRIEPLVIEPPAAVEAVSVEEMDSAFERRVREAEIEAKAYLESAKHRADTLVKSMVGAVEQQAAEARRAAEANIRTLELEANRQVDEARRVASRMVAERQARIEKLSEGISGRAEALTAGMDDADRVRAQFDTFVRALAVTADQIAREPTKAAVDGQIRELHESPRPSAIAA